MNLAVEPELGREVGSPGAGSHAWPKIRLGELYSQPSRNGVYKSKEHHGSGVRIVNMGELFAHDFIGPQEMNRLAMTDSEMEVAGLAEGDLLFGRRSLVEAGAGRCSLVAGLTEPATFESSIIRVRLDRERVNPRFFFYWLRSPVGKGTIRAIVTGTNVKGIRGSVLQNIMVPSPEKTIQDRCVSVLSAYDDLIENNRRRIKLLEHAALLQYREWFVFFRFPGHEHVPFVNALPEGWTRKSLRELSASVDYGYTASASTDAVGPKFLRITDIVPDQIDWSRVPYCIINEAQLERFSLAEGDIVVARTGATVGYAKRLHKRFPRSVFASYLVRLRLGLELESLIAGVFVESDTYKKYVLSRVGGAAQPNANAQVLAGAEIVVPPAPIQQSFRELTEPLFDLKEILQEQSRRLREARDLLLPKLITGEVEV